MWRGRRNGVVAYSHEMMLTHVGGDGEIQWILDEVNILSTGAWRWVTLTPSNDAIEHCKKVQRNWTQGAFHVVFQGVCKIEYGKHECVHRST